MNEKDFLYYSPEDVDKIVEIARGLPDSMLREELDEQLQVSAISFFGNVQSKIQPSASEMAKAFKGIEVAARKLLDKLCPPCASADPINFQLITETELLGKSIGGYEEFPPTKKTKNFQYNGQKRYRSILKGIEELEQSAKRARKRSEGDVQENKEEKKSHKGDIALQYLITDLVTIWSNIFSKKIGVSVDPISGKAVGPLVRFILACLEPLKRQIVGENAEFSAILAKSLNSATPEAIRNRIRNLR